MHRLSDGIIWAGTAALAFGVVVSSLLDGSSPPFLVVGLVILVGAAIVMLRRRRRRIAWERATMPALPAAERRPATRAGEPQQRSKTPAAPPRAPTRAATTTATGIPTGPEARRAGARGASLGDGQPPPGPGSS